MPAIQTIGLTKHFRPGRRVPFRPARTEAIAAVDSLDLSVNEGEIFGFLGPNGAGKSTTIRMLLGFLHPSGGGGRVHGLDVVRESVAIRRRTGYLPGGIALYDSLTGEALLEYLARLSDRPAVRRAELCEQLELSRRTLRRKVRDYSRGMRQKIGIVQALQHDPELAILDEPSEGLDPLMQRAFYDILDRLKAEGRTVFFSSHVLSEVERVCDRVAIIRGGRLVALEEVQSLLTRARRQVTLRVAGASPSLTEVAGVSHVEQRGEVLTCRLEGDPRPFLAAIQQCVVLDLTIEPARLEDTFVDFYGDVES